MKLTIHSAIANFGAKAKEKLANPAISGQPEDQLRSPFENLLADIAELSNLPKSAVAAVGESSLSDLKTRPDYAVTVHNALVGYERLGSRAGASVGQIVRGFSSHHRSQTRPTGVVTKAACTCETPEPTQTPSGRQSQQVAS
jgi:hypothetical protein